MGRPAVHPRVIVVGSDVHLLLILVIIPLVAVRHDDRLVVTGQILDEGGGCLDDISIQPENPGGAGSESCENKTVSGSTHRLATRLLVLHLVPLLLILRGERRIEILPKDADTREPRIDRSGLRLADSLFERRNSCVSVFR